MPKQVTYTPAAQRAGYGASITLLLNRKCILLDGTIASQQEVDALVRAIEIVMPLLPEDQE